ncbi:MAG: hypothetical protein RJA50_1136, partial [Actinomycetota bacterium]
GAGAAAATADARHRDDAAGRRAAVECIDARGGCVPHYARRVPARGAVLRAGRG